MTPKLVAGKHEAEDFLAGVLRSGVLLAATLVIAGGVYYLFVHGSEPPAYHHFVLPPPGSQSFRSVVRGVALGHSRSLIQLGLLALIATPVARVFFSLVLFLRERSPLYAAISLFVLLVLIASLTHF